MPTHAWAWPELHEPEWLRARGLDGLPEINTQLGAEDGHLVHQRDVHVPIGVLEQLRHLGLAGARHRMHLLDERAVEHGGFSGCRSAQPTDHFRSVAEAEGRVARVD